MKYFGVGLPRTGTKSLAAVFTMLGLRTQHVVLEGYDNWDAFCDTPVWADWRVLDETYPGSKFILTIRDPEAWAKSFERNLLTDYNRLLKVGQREVQHRRHNQDVRAYGQLFGERPYDRATFKGIFDQHHEAVLSYFESKSRRADLLVIDVANHSALGDMLVFMDKTHSDLHFPRLSGGWDGPVNP